jgi:hypothetical protein
MAILFYVINTSDITFGEVSDFMKANLDLSPNQLVLLTKK